MFHNLFIVHDLSSEYDILLIEGSTNDKFDMTPLTMHTTQHKTWGFRSLISYESEVG